MDRLREAGFQRLGLHLDWRDFFLKAQLALAPVSVGGSVLKLGKAVLELVEGLGDQPRPRFVVRGLGELLVESQGGAHGEIEALRRWG